MKAELHCRVDVSGVDTHTQPHTASLQGSLDSTVTISMQVVGWSGEWVSCGVWGLMAFGDVLWKHVCISLFVLLE